MGIRYYAYAFHFDQTGRAMVPAEMPAIARDLDALEQELRPIFDGRTGVHDEAGYARQYLVKARHFVTRLAADGRGMAYLAG